MGEECLSLTVRLQGTSDKSANEVKEETSSETAEKRGSVGEKVPVPLQDRGSGESMEAQAWSVLLLGPLGMSSLGAHCSWDGRSCSHGFSP